MSYDNDLLLPDREVRRRYGISEMTVWRWERNPALGFPQAIRINRRKYRRLAELEAFERQRAAGKATEAAA